MLRLIATLARAGVLAPVPPRRLAGMLAAAVELRPGLALLGALAAARFPDRPAVADDEGVLTYAELDRRTAALAGALHVEYGVGPDRPVGVMCRNHRGFVVSSLAASRLGADLVCLNTEFPGPQLAQALARERVDVVVLDEEFTGAFDAAGFTGTRVLDRGPGVTVDALVARAPTAPRRRPPGRVVVLTSGSTGTPKGVPRRSSAGSVAGTTIALVSTLSLRVGQVLVVAPPLFHGFGFVCLALALFLGDTVVLRRRFDAPTVLADVDRWGAGVLAVVPTMLQRMLEVPPDVRARHDLSSLRAIVSGAAPLSPTLSEAAMDAFGDVLFNLYGASESGFATVATPADLRAAPGTVGRPVLGSTVRLLDSDGRPVPPGTTGRIVIRGGMVFQGYSGGGGRPAGGEVATGDLGHVDAAGRLFIDGRQDDMVVSGGENVFPQEVADVLTTHPDVADAAVVGVDDPVFGQRLRAYVVGRPGTTPDAEELRAYVRTRLPRYKVPRDVVPLPEIPRNPAGKVMTSRLP